MTDWTTPDAIRDPWLREQWRQSAGQAAGRERRRREAQAENVAYYRHDVAHRGGVTEPGCRWCAPERLDR